MKKIFKKQNEQGSFLVELMVGLVMSALSVLGILTIYAEFEGQKRTSSQMSETITNAAIALFPLQHDTKNAGFGINASGVMGCTTRAYEEGKGEFSLVIAPALVTASGDNKISDTIAFFTGQSDAFFAPLSITQSMPNSASALKMNSTFGYKEGELLIVMEPGKDCTLMQITQVQDSINNEQVIHNSGRYTDPVTGQQVNAKYNKAGGLGVTYATGAQVVNIGASPQNIIYRVVNNELTRTNSLDGNVARTVANNIVLLKARYGIDNDGNGEVDEWTNRVLAANEYGKVLALRVALIARSPLREKSEGGECNITTNNEFTWSGGTMDISDLPDWQCFRYRKLETTIPLRNLIWKS